MELFKQFLKVFDDFLTILRIKSNRHFCACIKKRVPQKWCKFFLLISFWYCQQVLSRLHWFSIFDFNCVFSFFNMSSIVTRSRSAPKVPPFINNVLCALIKRYQIDNSRARSWVIPEEQQCVDAIESILITGSHKNSELQSIDEYFLESDKENWEEEQIRQNDSLDKDYVPPVKSKSCWTPINVRRTRAKIKQIQDFWYEKKSNPKYKFPSKTTIKKFEI